MKRSGSSLGRVVVIDRETAFGNKGGFRAAEQDSHETRQLVTMAGFFEDVLEVIMNTYYCSDNCRTALTFKKRLTSLKSLASLVLWSRERWEVGSMIRCKFLHCSC